MDKHTVADKYPQDCTEYTYAKSRNGLCTYPLLAPCLVPWNQNPSSLPIQVEMSKVTIRGSVMSDFELSIVPRSESQDQISTLRQSGACLLLFSPGLASSLPLASARPLCQDASPSRVNWPLSHLGGDTSVGVCLDSFPRSESFVPPESFCLQ